MKLQNPFYHLNLRAYIYDNKYSICGGLFIQNHHRLCSLGGSLSEPLSALLRSGLAMCFALADEVGNLPLLRVSFKREHIIYHVFSLSHVKYVQKKKIYFPVSLNPIMRITWSRDK